MKDFIEILLKENEELALKIVKLQNFIGSETFSELSLIEKDMLEAQLVFMKKYNEILKRRIKFYKEYL